MSMEATLSAVSPRDRTTEVVPSTVIPGEVILPRDAGGPSPAHPLLTGSRRRSAALWLAVAVVLLILAGGGYWWWKAQRPLLPPGFASGNGRLEADVVDIDTKFAGRVARLLADEGDMVRSGQVVAVMDTRDLEAQLGQAEAQIRQAQRGVEEADRNVAQQ